MTRRLDTKAPMKPFDFSDMKKTRWDNYYILELLFTKKAEVIFNYIGVYCSRIWNAALEIHIINFDKGHKKPLNAEKMYRQYFNKWKAQPGNGSLLANVPKEIYIHTLSDLTKSCENAFRIRRKDRLPGPLTAARDRFRLGKAVIINQDKRQLVFPKIGPLKIVNIHRQHPYSERQSWMLVEKIEGTIVKCAVFRSKGRWIIGIVTKKLANMGSEARKNTVRGARKQRRRFGQFVGSYRDTNWIQQQQKELGIAREQSIMEQSKEVKQRIDYVGDTKP